jgi:hypothetical protein
MSISFTINVWRISWTIAVGAQIDYEKPSPDLEVMEVTELETETQRRPVGFQP